MIQQPNVNELSPETVELMLKAIKMTNDKTKRSLVENQRRERKMILTSVFIVVLNLVSLVMVLNKSDSGLAQASIALNTPEHSQAKRDDDVARESVESALAKLKAMTEGQQSTLNRADFSRTQEKTALENRSLRSKLTPVIGDRSGIQTPDLEVETYYGESLSYDDVVRHEQNSIAPHSSGQGANMGFPAPPRSKRVQEVLRNRIPLSTSETLYLKKLVDDNERATYATPDVEQRTIKMHYSEGKIPSITVAKNNISTLSFVDKFGNPFPISAISPKGAGELFTTQLIDYEGTHANVAEIRGSKLNGSSNISVMLTGRTLPAVFKIKLSHTVNDARTIVQLNSAAPGFENVSLPAATHGQELCSQDSMIESILDGVVPASLQKLDTGVSSMSAYRSATHHYIRSLNQIIDPECSCRIYGVDNLNVCKQPVNIPAILYVDRETDEFGTLALNRDA
ncbi:MAG: DotH/IcmK family type IV secretion protein [Pseudomonadota bacterium]